MNDNFKAGHLKHCQHRSIDSVGLLPGPVIKQSLGYLACQLWAFRAIFLLFLKIFLVTSQSVSMLSIKARTRYTNHLDCEWNGAFIWAWI